MQAQVSPTRSLSGRIDPPSSKNYTTRYLLAAAPAAGESIVRFPASTTMRLQCDAAYVNWAPKLKMSKTRLARLSGYEVLGDGPKIPALSIPTTRERCCAC